MPPLLRRWATIFGIASLLTFFLLAYLDLVSLLPDRYDTRLGPPRDKFRKWRKIKEDFPVKQYIALPNGIAPEIPRLQHDFSKYRETEAHKIERRRRMDAVTEAFNHSWSGYREHAWLHDEVTPLSGKKRDPFGRWAVTLIDSLDTLWVMGMEKEFAIAQAGLRQIDFTTCDIEEINLFETVIRVLGGLLGAYDVCEGKYATILQKAIELGEMLYHAFDTPNRMPYALWNWTVVEKGEGPQSSPLSASIAELGSLTLEFTRLTQLTGDPKYYDAVQRIMEVFATEQSKTVIPGLWPIQVDPSNENFHSDTTFTMGGRADSVYEYLPKEHLLLGGRDPLYHDMYLRSIEAAKTYLAFEPLIPLQSDNAPTFAQSAITVDYSNPLLLGTAKFSGPPPSNEYPFKPNSIELIPKSQHLSCFAGGMVALAARAFAPFQSRADNEEDLSTAERLTAGCVWAYNSTASGIAPEVFHTTLCRRGRAAITSGEEKDWLRVTPSDCRWSEDRWLTAVRARAIARDRSADASQIALVESEEPDHWMQEVMRTRLPKGMTEIEDSRYMLRPEAIESVFIMWRTTGDPIWQDRAWEMFGRITTLTRTDIAFAGLEDVTTVPADFDLHLHGSDADPSVHSNSRRRHAVDNSDNRISIASEDPVSLAKRVPAHPHPSRSAQNSYQSDVARIDRMESFWLAETLKYFYLIFSEPDVVSLDSFVFNTEGHPFKWRGSLRRERKGTPDSVWVKDMKRFGLHREGG